MLASQLRATRPGHHVCRHATASNLRTSTIPRISGPSRIVVAASQRRYAASETGDHKTGHIEAGPNENILYFDNVFPLKLNWLFRLPFIGAEQSLPSLMKRVQTVQAVDPRQILQGSKTPINVTEVLPRLKEGGAFVKFSHDPATSPQEVAQAVQTYLRETQIKPWFNPFQRMRARLVEGRPWVEDLYRVPSSRIKVEFLPSAPGETPAELTQEQVYSFFRSYGKLNDIVGLPSDSKVFPRYSLVDFAMTRRAIMAKNCLHGYLVPQSEGGGKTGTLLRISYEQKMKTHWIRDWIVNHPRIVLPILAAIVAGITVAVFDPVRTFFVKMHITRAFHLADFALIRWLRAQAEDVLHTFHHTNDENAAKNVIWEDRKTQIDSLQGWLKEANDTFIVIQGPRGSGKRDLVLDQALKKRRNKLVIDCRPIQEARGDSATIRTFAAQVGYRPVFSWINSISGWLDLIAQGTTGMKTGFSETLDTQLDKILNNTATALKQIALETRRKDDPQGGTDDDYLEGHPERRPVVVIDNFLHKSQDSVVVYDKLAEWAAQLATANIAHIIFLTHDVSFSKSLSKALPDRVFHNLSLSDCSPEAAKRYVLSHLELELDAAMKATPEAAEEDKENGTGPLSASQRRRDMLELESCSHNIDILGGRLTDLEFMVRRIKSGETPSKAVHEMVLQSASEIQKLYLYTAGEEKKWTAEQAWQIIKMLAASSQGTLRYNELLLTDPYKSSGSERVLQALEQAELITIQSSNGRPSSIKPGKPIYWAAFQKLTEDKVLKAKFDLLGLNEQVKGENANIDKWENELRLLGELPGRPMEISGRVKWLLAKVDASQKKIEGLESRQAEVKKVLVEEY